MKEINLIVSQEKLEENRKNEILKEKTKENYKKQERIVKFARQFIVFALLFLLMICGLYVGQGLKNTGYTNCIDNGYSEAYCLKNS